MPRCLFFFFFNHDHKKSLGNFVSNEFDALVNNKSDKKEILPKGNTSFLGLLCGLDE